MTEHVVEIPHSPLGPSASERWLACPGSVLLTKDMEDPDSWFAAEGSAAHELSEWCRVHKTEASTYRGQVIKVGQYEFTVDQEMIDGVDTFVQECEQWPGRGLYEVRVSYNEWVPNAFGTMDDARLTDGLARVTDLKYGKGVLVEAHDNSQLKLYALGLYHDYRHLYDFKDFILTISQPRLDHLDRFEIKLPELLAWAEDVVKPTAALAMQPGAPIKPGDWCVFCPARRTCRARADFLTKNALRDFQNIEAPLLSNEEIGAMLPHVANAKKFLNDLEAHALSELAKGHPVPHPDKRVGDWKIVEGRSTRGWKDNDEQTAGLLCLEFEVSNVDEFFAPRKLKSPAQVEKIVGKGKIDDFVHKPQGKPKLAPGNDKRPTLVISAESEFNSIEDE